MVFGWVFHALANLSPTPVALVDVVPLFDVMSHSALARLLLLTCMRIHWEDKNVDTKSPLVRHSESRRQHFIFKYFYNMK